eukprot:scpid22486/ scgid21637/ NACHT, LRR and PYD domains-containing protein 3; Cold autoinflammatory syndrome 1 protein homolog; Cryopyrin; Mast cell maturation-associated-inducible protein 1; PYRIN-containing APAF1-like protein 1
MGNSVSPSGDGSEQEFVELNTFKFLTRDYLEKALSTLSTTDGEPLNLRNVPLAVNLLNHRIHQVWDDKLHRYDHYVYKDSGREALDISLETVFEPRGEEERADANLWPKNVMVIGEAGSGKTALFAQILVYLWANGQLWSDKFELVAALSMADREVQLAESLQDLLSVVLADVAMADAERASEHFQRNPSRLCVVLDGVNECYLGACSDFMRNVLRRQTLHGVHLIVTGRQCPTLDYICKTGHYRRHYEMVGLTPTSLNTLLRRNLAADAADDIIAKMASDAKLAVAMTLPLLARLACDVVSSRSATPPPGCLAAALEYSVVSALHAAGLQVESLRDWKNVVSTECLRVLGKLGQFAFHMLIGHRVSFTEEEINTSLDETTRQLGLVTTIANDGLATRSRRYRFVSMAMQEFLAALYVNKWLLGAGQEHTSILAQRLDCCSYDLRVFWRYVAAIAPAPGPADWVLSAMWGGVAARREEPSFADLKPVTDIDTTAVLLPGDGASPATLTTKQLEEELEKMPLEKMEELADGLLAATSLSTAGRQLVYERIPSSVGTVTEQVYMTTLLSLWRRSTPLPSGAYLHAALQTVSPEAAADLKVLLLPPLIFSKIAPQVFGSGNGFRGNYPTQMVVMEAYYEHCRYHGYAKPPDFNVLASLRKTGLSIQLTMSPWQCSVVAYTIDCHGNEALEFDVSDCFIGNAGLERISPALQRYGSLKRLYLSDCGITDARQLVAILSSVPKLSRLSLSNNHLGDHGLAMMQAALESFQHLSAIRLSNIGLTNASLHDIIALIRQLPALSLLDVGRNEFSDADPDIETAFVEAVRTSQLWELSIRYVVGRGKPETFADELKELEKDESHSLERLFILNY